eukprot:scaffold22575_cov141-Cylindrotheca_fusiformis.AAC.46
MAETRRGGGILGKILLPGYTDAGPDSSFQPVRVAAGGAHNHYYNNVDDDDDKASEAATEIHDNRTTVPRNHTPIPHHPRLARPSPRSSTNHSSGGENYGFFPSTKPVPSPPIPSPRPQSPPDLSRRQISTSSVGGTSTVPETGAFSQEELEQFQSSYWREEGGRTGGEIRISDIVERGAGCHGREEEQFGGVFRWCK